MPLIYYVDGNLVGLPPRLLRFLQTTPGVKDSEMRRDDLLNEIETLRRRVAGLRDVEVRLAGMERLEKGRRAADQLLVDAIEFLPDAAFVIDQDKRIIVWNRACEIMTGVKKEALLGRGDYAYAEPFFGERRPILIDLLDLAVPELEATYKYVTRKGHLILAESFIPRLRDGKGAHLWGVAGPLFDQDGRRCGAIEVIRDVTEQKNIEQALRESEVRHRTLFETAGDAILLIRHDRFVDCNSRTQVIFGSSRDEIIGSFPHEFSPPLQPDGRPSEDKAMEKINLALTYGPQLFEWEHCRRDGTPFMAEVSLNRFDWDGETLIQAIVRDITDRKRVEERLVESERKYRELVEHANSIILRWTLDGKITFLNEFGQKFFGYSCEEILGRHVVGTIVPETDSGGHDLAPLMDRILADPIAFEQNVNENITSGGERVVIAWTNKIVSDERGQIAEILSIGTDITGLKRTQEELKERNEELHAINRIISAVTGFLDLGAVLEQVLEEALDLVGLEGGAVCLLEPDETLKLAACRAVPAPTVRCLTAGVRMGDCLCGECGRTLEPSILSNREEIRSRAVPESTRKDPIHFHVSYPLVTAGRRVGVLCMFTSVERKPSGQKLALLEAVTGQLALAIENAQLYEASYRHAVELERIVADRTKELALAKERAEAADHLKSAFLANMSHELRTPLNSIIGFTGIILQGLAGPLNPEQAKQLEMVRSSSRHLLALINDVLDISKIEAGQFEIAGERFDLRESIYKVLGIVAPLAERKGLALHALVDPGLGEAVGDQRRVEQILINLLNNAIKFTDRGEVALKTALVHNFASPEGTSAQTAVRLCVSDTGIGIKSDDLKTLFQPFRQIESGLSRNYEGTGLGLAICRRLAHLMGGDISAESTWSKGSTFSFTLPLQGSGQT
ncbi:MAG: PAS domain S-box protein [Pseudomonadota bacterium]